MVIYVFTIEQYWTINDESILWIVSAIDGLGYESDL